MSTDKQVVRQIGFDTALIDSKVIVDDEHWLAMQAVIASEIVHQYEDGWAYKPADELEKMAEYANVIGSVPVKVLTHPGAGTDYKIIQGSDLNGKATNFQFVKNLIDAKTQRPCRRGVKADIYWNKKYTDEATLEQARTGKLNNVSIGFDCEKHLESGDFQGQHYDYVQRNIFLNHVAAPIEAGRCPGPVCGIGVDSKAVNDVSDCPVCLHMKEAGWNTAGKRLYAAYGPDVLEVIDTGVLPKVEVPQSTIDEDFRNAFQKLDSNLKRTSY